MISSNDDHQWIIYIKLEPDPTKKYVRENVIMDCYVPIIGCVVPDWPSPNYRFVVQEQLKVYSPPFGTVNFVVLILVGCYRGACPVVPAI